MGALEEPLIQSVTGMATNLHPKTKHFTKYLQKRNSRINANQFSRSMTQTAGKLFLICIRSKFEYICFHMEDVVTSLTTDKIQKAIIKIKGKTS